MDTELMTDDDVLRERGMTDGTKRIGKIELRPVTALSLSWMQRNKVFDESSGDLMQKTAAFVFLHSEDKAGIRAVVNDRNSFADAVDEWIDRNVQHHSELEPYADAMNDAMQQYLAAVSTSQSSPGARAGAKN